MEETKNEKKTDVDLQSLVHRAISEYVRQDTSRQEPVLKAELLEERRRREQLEKRLNQMAEENKRNREVAEKAERSSTIRAELQSLGVAKVDLAYKAVKDEIVRTEDGRLVAKTENGETGVREFLSSFVAENPEFLPARIAGGSGAAPPVRTVSPSGPIDIESISPTMSTEEKERVRQEIMRVTSQSLRGV